MSKEFRDKVKSGGLREVLKQALSIATNEPRYVASDQCPEGWVFDTNAMHCVPQEVVDAGGEDDFGLDANFGTNPADLNGRADGGKDAQPEKDREAGTVPAEQGSQGEREAAADTSPHGAGGPSLGGPDNTTPARDSFAEGIRQT